MSLLCCFLVDVSVRIVIYIHKIICRNYLSKGTVIPNVVFFIFFLVE